MAIHPEADQAPLQQLLSQVQQQATELNTLFDSLMDVVILFDAQGKAVRANRAAIAAYGFDPVHADRQAVINKFSLRHLDGTPYQLQELPSLRALNGELVESEKARFTQPAGEERTILLTAFPVYSKENILSGVILSWHDITEIERANTILARYQVMFDQTNEILLFVRFSDGRILEANQAAVRAYGYPREELLQLTVRDLRGSETLNELRAQMDQANNQGILFETVHRRKDGTTFPVEVSSQGANFEGERANLSIVRDMTERNRAAEQIRLQSAALSATANGVVITTASGSIVWANPAFTRISGYTLEEAVGKNPRELLRSGFHDQAFYKTLWETILSGQVWQGEMINRRKDGSLYPEEMTINPVRGPTGEITHFIAVKQDITLRKLAEKEVRVHQVRVEIQQHLLKEREQERQQIARDLHDGPVQELAAASFTLEGMVQDCQDPQMLEKYQLLKNAIRGTIAELRSYAGELRPPTLAKFGLAKAIESHMQSFMEKHPEILVRLEEEWESPLLHEIGRVALFRIYQESMVNITKHAQASEVIIRLKQLPDQAEMVVQDNGVGFELPADWMDLVHGGHLGLVGMLERAEALGGKCEILSAPGQGTQVRVVVPLAGGE